MNDMTGNVTEIMMTLGQKARTAARELANAPTAQKNKALSEAAIAIRASTKEILAANAKDVEKGKKDGMAASFLDRLTLDEKRIDAIAQGLDAIVKLPDPVGSIMAGWDRPNGLHIERVRTPLGVIGVIYESRPNVTADAGALCLKAGNASILRGGSDSYHSSRAIHACLMQGLKAAGLSEHCVQMVPTTDRAAVGEMLKGLGGNVDVIVPRGGKGLVGRVQDEARVPVFSHLEGVCHLYIHEAADAEKALAIAVNAKMRRTGICGAAETLLLDRKLAQSHAKPIVKALQDAGCTIHGTEEVIALTDNVVAASDKDWHTEYLSADISVKLVDNIAEAIDHIATYSSSHTESIITEDAKAASRFLNEVDSAIVMHNASTQFADGGEFGMGAEIGIATGRMHARGPVGLEQLTSFKYRVHGTGQIRP
ncbi:glutamate-5-semialdehyde dehydrogenase [Cohaesibacter gelatinilyticus]|uniref:Gamma-glutamyl phosphate reductase n=1 Tax=Cohaesibacter gelatinilyticus TaxID=372072 RepID=A0A285PEK5_9HYPH|nr:glutamate-5-semialdehyde dehydrogenase [Cohaesibacter gelatinilyticus]SNZ19703.1 glutamate-5-semialdehyde dehydrogenase [Cohaesibacter gelatinilyticus]